MRSDNQNKSVHAVATSVVFDRTLHLEDHEPQQSQSDTDILQLVELGEDDLLEQRQMFKMIAAKILCKHLPAFGFFKESVNSIGRSFKYNEEMKQKSTIVPFPVILKDEKKYGEIVDILDQLETWVHKIYAKAGVIEDSQSYDTNSSTAPGVGDLPATSTPDQPLSHAHPPPYPSDPLAKVRVPCYGDQLTRVRLAGAKDLRAGCHTARDRLDHIHPIKIAEWHCKRSFLKVCRQEMLKSLT